MVASLTPYRQMIFFPGGNLAAFTQIGVVLEGSNVPPAVFSDAAGTIPLSLPLTSDAMGTVAFYAAPGCYLAVLSGTRTRVGIDPAHTDPVFADIYVHTQAAPALVWTIDHHLGVQPAVSVILATQNVETHVDHPDAQQTVLTFSQPVAGVAQLRR